MQDTRTLRSWLAVGVCAAAITGVAMPALAQTASNSNVIEELVVTAQKKEEALQDVPIAVSAFDQNALEKSKCRQCVEHWTDEREDHKERMLGPANVEEAAHRRPKASKILFDHVHFERGDREQKRRQDGLWRQRPPEIRQAPQNKGSTARTADNDDRRPTDIPIAGQHCGQQKDGRYRHAANSYR